MIDVIDPDRAGERLRRAYELADEIGSHQQATSITMFLAIHELHAGDDAAAAHWARRSLQLAVDHGPTYIAQAIDTAVAISRRRSTQEAAVLLGALRAHRERRGQDGTQVEIDAEARAESSLRRQLGEQFDDLYGQGHTFDDSAMLALAFVQLDAAAGASIAETDGPQVGRDPTHRPPQNAR